MLCRRTFTQASVLKTHMKIHSNDPKRDSSLPKQTPSNELTCCVSVID